LPSDSLENVFNPHTSSHGLSGAELTRPSLNAPNSNQKSNCNARSAHIGSLDERFDHDIKPLRSKMEIEVAKKTKTKIVRREYTKADVKELRAHSKARTPLAKIMKLTKRTEGSLRQKALKLGISLGHRR
jgi:hypothetical protein